MSDIEGNFKLLAINWFYLSQALISNSSKGVNKLQFY